MKIKAEKQETKYRRFPHANSARKISNRFKEDAVEAGEYSADPIRERKGKRQIPDFYDDETTAASGKYLTKPKKNDRKRDTIRRPEEEEELLEEEDA